MKVLRSRASGTALATALAIALAAIAVVHADAAEAPLPPERPPELSDTKAPTPAMPLPPERPAALESGNAPVTTPDPPLSTHPGQLTAAPVPPARPRDLSGDAALSALLDVPEDTACLRRLDALGVKYEKLPPIVNGQCTVAHPLDLTSIGDGVAMTSISVTADQMVVCGVAEGLGGWATDAQAAAGAELGDRLKGLTLGGGYHCRGQNNVGEAKLSEHAFANAIDIMGFTFRTRGPITVGFLPEGSAEARFLASVRASACKHFRTVLGPGSNESHANHLHFDQRQRDGGHRICELGPPQAAAPAAPGAGTMR